MAVRFKGLISQQVTSFVGPSAKWKWGGPHWKQLHIAGQQTPETRGGAWLSMGPVWRHRLHAGETSPGWFWSRDTLAQGKMQKHEGHCAFLSALLLTNGSEKKGQSLRGEKWEEAFLPSGVHLPKRKHKTKTAFNTKNRRRKGRRYQDPPERFGSRSWAREPGLCIKTQC